LGAEGLQLALRRRSLAILTGSWRRGRILAQLFTLAGLTTAAFMVGTERLGTAAGTIELSVWFTLWSFIGLLTLPTLSRRGVAEVDERLLSEGIAQTAVETIAADSTTCRMANGTAPHSSKPSSTRSRAWNRGFTALTPSVGSATGMRLARRCTSASPALDCWGAPSIATVDGRPCGCSCPRTKFIRNRSEGEQSMALNLMFIVSEG